MFVEVAAVDVPLVVADADADASDAAKSDVADAPLPNSAGVGCRMLADGRPFALDRKVSNVLPVVGALIAPTMPALQCVLGVTCEQ